MEYWSQVIKSQRARKSLSVLNVFGLSVCIGAALLIMLYVWFELSFDSFHNGDRVYRVESRLYEGATLTDNWATTSFGHAPAMSREIPGIEQYVRVTAQDRGQEVTFGDRQFIEEQYCYTEPAFFDLFNFPILKGGKSEQLVRPNTMVITESAARRYFADGEPIGKVLAFRTSSSEQHFEVTGVIADMPYNSHLHYDFLLSYSTIPEARRDIWYIHGVYTYIRLEPGKKPADIETAFHAISGKYKTTALKHKDWKVELIHLYDIHLTPRKSYEKEGKGSSMAIRILSVMAIALLLIGWVNALNLTVARYLERGREFGIRKAFGASRRQVVLQGLLEAGLLNLSALILALGWVEVLLPFARRWAELDFAAGAFLSPEFWIMVASVFIGGDFIYRVVSVVPADTHPSGRYYAGKVVAQPQREPDAESIDRRPVSRLFRFDFRYAGGDRTGSLHATGNFFRFFKPNTGGEISGFYRRYVCQNGEFQETIGTDTLYRSCFCLRCCAGCRGGELLHQSSLRQ